MAIGYFKKAYIPLIILLLLIVFNYELPNKQRFTSTTAYMAVLILLTAIYIVAIILSHKQKRIYEKVKEKVPLLSAVFISIGIWDILTSKLNILPLPYFPGPDKVFEVFISDWKLIGISIFYSLRLLFIGYVIGGLVGFVSGLLMGWSKKWNYWFGPLIKVIGPIPASAWIPLSMALFPTSFWAGVFLISLAVWFPVTVMTSSGIANVPNAYFEVAKTLGADEKYLIFKVAIPAALPTIFIGLFMGLGTSFLTLIVSEMLGVKAGLGWYINWAQGWAEYSKVYAALLVIAAIFSTIITFLFKVRDRLLTWQRGLIKW